MQSRVTSMLLLTIYKYVMCIKSQFSLPSTKISTNERRPHCESSNQMSEGDQSMCFYAPKYDSKAFLAKVVSLSFDISKALSATAHFVNSGSTSQELALVSGVVDGYRLP